MFCQYGLKGIETVEKCLKIVERPSCHQIFIGKKQEYVLIFLQKYPRRVETNNMPERWLKSHGKQWTGNHSQRTKLNKVWSKNILYLQSRGHRQHLLRKSSELLWTSDCYVLSTLPLSRSENLYGSFSSHFITIWWVCIGQLTFFSIVYNFLAQEALYKPEVDHNTLAFKHNARTWDIEVNIFHIWQHISNCGQKADNGKLFGLMALRFHTNTPPIYVFVHVFSL